MRKLYYHFLPALLVINVIISCKKNPVSEVVPANNSIIEAPAIAAQPNVDTDPTDAIVSSLFDRNENDGADINIRNDIRGGQFIYKPKSAKLFIDNGIVFASKDGGFWERQIGDTVKLAWYNLNTTNTDNADVIRKGIQTAIDRRVGVVTFPFAGLYKVKSGSYWTVFNNSKLQIDGKGAEIQVEKEAADLVQETYIMAFRCTENVNSLNSKITIKNLNIKAPAILPKWTNKNYGEHRLVMAIETDGIYDVDINNCKLNDICGYGIRLKNFVAANIDHVTENNVGGHFPLENDYDSFGDGIWLGHYNVETIRTSRKNSHAKISNCIFKGYNTATNGNFASRSGITIEGFSSYRADIVVNVEVDNTTISDYDRNFHVEGISSNLTYTNCTMRNFFGLGLVVNSVNTNLTYNNCNASGLLEANSQQERYGLGGIMQFSSSLNLYLNKQTVFTFNKPASFRANMYIQDKSILDFGNHDIFFDTSNLHVNTGGSIINIPASVPRGYNMYGGSVDFNGGIFSAYNKAPNEMGVFHGENIGAASVIACKLNNTRLFFAGGVGALDFK